MDEFEKWFTYKSEGVSFDRNHKLTAKTWALEAWKEFQKENDEIREELKREQKVVDFYASKTSWNHDGQVNLSIEGRKVNQSYGIDIDDVEKFKADFHAWGGKRARQRVKQRKGI